MKTLVSAAAVAAIAGSAFGLGQTLDRSYYPNLPGATITFERMSDVDRGALNGPHNTSVYGWDDAGLTYSNLAQGQGVALDYGGIGGVVGVQDYGTTFATTPIASPTGQGDLFAPSVFKFWGGTTGANTNCYFDFYLGDASTLANGFSFNVGPYAGYYIWTITFGTSGFQIPEKGFMSFYPDVNDQAIWLRSPFGDNPDFGFTDGLATSYFGAPPGPGTYDFGNGGVDVGWLFAIGVPTPGTAALMGLAGLAGVTRRRR
jgi:hypothetical protein